MEHIDKTINRIIKAIDWRKIKSYHKKLGILWEFNDDKQVTRRVPTIGELQDEFRSIVSHMCTENLNYISYGNWVIFWDRDSDSIGDIRVIFRLVDFHFEENRNSRESLEEALRKAIEKEDYENAAILRDTIRKKHEED
jgi:hypothetical protein